MWFHTGNGTDCLGERNSSSTCNANWARIPGRSPCRTDLLSPRRRCNGRRCGRKDVATLQTTALSRPTRAAAASHPGFVQAASHRAAVPMVAARTALRPRRSKTRACNAAREDGSADTPQPLNTCTVPHIQLSYAGFGSCLYRTTPDTCACAHAPAGARARARPPQAARHACTMRDNTMRAQLRKHAPSMHVAPPDAAHTRRGVPRAYSRHVQHVHGAHTRPRPH